VSQLQPLLDEGRTQPVLTELKQALQHRPQDSKLHYNYGIAAYAAGRFDEALVAFDQAEYQGGRKLSRLARFQKGNVEYRLGQSAMTSNLDETITRWKLALQTFESILEEETQHAAAGTNSQVVRKKLMTLLLTDARKHMEQAAQPNLHPMHQLESLRNAFQKYTDATEVDPTDAEAQEGEEEARDQLAQSLAKMGRQLANAPFRQRPNPREPALPDLDLTSLEEGVGMLQDANQLKPDDASIAKSLQDARNRLADADVIKARSYMALEERIGWVREKLAVLRMAREVVEKALTEVPDHQTAQDTHEEINRRLARVHEDEGDILSQQAEMANLQQAMRQPPSPEQQQQQQPNQASPSPSQQADQRSLEQQSMQLSQALDHFQQSQDLEPDNPRLPPKIEQTENKLAQALDQLADRLMQAQSPNESMEQQAARLEGADQALNQLDGLQPSQRTSDRARQVAQELNALREAMAGQNQGQQPGEQQGEGPPRPGQSPGQQMARFGVPMDSRPKINTPGMKGEWNSQTMNAAKDY
jgi:hypothetical protein